MDNTSDVVIDRKFSDKILAASVDTPSIETSSRVLLDDEIGFDLDCYPQIELRFDARLKALWLTFAPHPRPCFTPELVESTLRLQQKIAQAFGRRHASPAQPIKFLVIDSAIPDVFNLGGDIGYILETIERHDHEAIYRYFRNASSACHAFIDGFGAGLLSVALVRGSAFGAGMELAACCDIVIAEEQSVFQLPELRFSMFPGTAAANGVAQRIGGHRTFQIAVEGRALTAEEGKEWGLVDRLARRGAGREMVEKLLMELEPKHAAVRMLRQNLLRVAGVTLESMLSESDFHSQMASQLPDEAIDTLRRLVKAQGRRFGRSSWRMEAK